MWDKATKADSAVQWEQKIMYTPVLKRSENRKGNSGGRNEERGYCVFSFKASSRTL